MPFPNEHSARIINPGEFKKESFRRINIADGIDTIQGRLENETTMTVQSYRFNAVKRENKENPFHKKVFTEKQAKKWLNDHNIEYILFEKAEIENKMPKSKQIFLTGYVDSWMSNDIRNEIESSKEKRIDVYISSYGGSVDHGFEIANLIQGIEATNSKEIHTYNLAHADSIATVIFLAAKKENRHIVGNSTMFYHEPRYIVIDEVTKNDAELMARELELQKNRIADFYIKNIEGLDKNEAFSLMEGETTIGSEKMLSLGIVSEVQETFKIAACKTITNLKFKQMGLFGKKEPINTLQLSEDVTIAFYGELKEGIEVQKIGENCNLEGEYITNSKKIVIDSNNKIIEMSNIEVNDDDKNFMNEISKVVNDIIEKALTDFRNEIDEKIENIRKTGSTQKIEKIENKSTDQFNLGTQSSVRKNTNEYLNAILKKRREKQEKV